MHPSRGGSFNALAWEAHSAARFSSAATFAAPEVGVRPERHLDR